MRLAAQPPRAHSGPGFCRTPFWLVHSDRQNQTCHGAPPEPPLAHHLPSQPRYVIMLLPLTLLAQPAAAHPAAASAVELTLHADRAHVEMQVPRDQLEMAVDLESLDLEAYVLEHFALVDDGGVPLQAGPPEIRWGGIDEAPHLLVSLDLQRPDGAPLGSLRVDDTVVLHQVVTHKIYVTVTQDPWNQGVIHAEPQLAGVIGWPTDHLELPREAPSAGRLVLSGLKEGAAHIAVGWDHLLFLLTLLLVAPVRAHQGAWVPSEDTGSAIRSVLGLITAFTLGHSLTLALTAFGVLALPSSWVELCVALSIALAAVHAIRPLWPRAERWLALGFGLIHGMAFAENLVGLGVDFSVMAWTLVGFDLGVEAVQLGLAAVVVPGLLWLRTRRYAPVRLGLSALAILAAGLWTLQRLPL